MDVINALKNIKALDDYGSITEDMLKNISSFKHQLNSINLSVATVRVLKSIQSTEVQYFHMYNKFGAAQIMFELLLEVPSLKKGTAFGKELVSLVQYWLSSVRKFLIHQNEHWWKFLRKLLDFIEKLCLKHEKVNMYLVQHTGECLLDLATDEKLNTEQRFQILQCFNKCSELAARGLRKALKDKYDKYFTRLAAWLPRCGDVVVQYAVLETLLRWLQPRQDEGARRNAAARWLPATLYPQRALQVFLDKTWLNFFDDARQFLNATNKTSDRVVSVLVEKFSVGSVSLLSVNTSREYWLDLNTESRSVSMMADSMLYQTLNVAESSMIGQALFVTDTNTTSAVMCSGPRGPILLLRVIDPLQIFPSKVLENKNTVKVTICKDANVQRIDKALRTIFDDKYQFLKNDDASFLELSQTNSSRIMGTYISEEETLFSNSPEIIRRKLLEQRAAAEKSPSSASTPSLLVLTEKLKNLPDFVFEKKIRTGNASRLPTVMEVSHVRYADTSVYTVDDSINDAADTSVYAVDDSINDAFVENAVNINTRIRNRKPTFNWPINKGIVKNSRDTGFYKISPNFNYQEVEDCLKFIVSNVCENLNQPLRQNSNQSNILDTNEIEVGHRNIRLERATNSKGKEEKERKRRRGLDEKTTDNHLDTPLSKRKRKLYSPKDDDLISKRTGIHVSETEDDNSDLTSCKPADKSQVPTATPYKEIEKIRKNKAIRLRILKSKAVSPKTKNTNDVFDRIKNTVENNENITIVEKGAEYNFTSSSESDGDFHITVPPPNTASVKSKPVKRNPPPKPKPASKDDSNRDTKTNTRTRSRRQIVEKLLTAEPKRELIDERMRRDNTEVLNSSLINEYNTEEINTQLEPVHKIPRVEIIPCDKEYEKETAPVLKKTKKQTKNTKIRAKKGKKTVENKPVTTTNTADDDNRTISPLPGLEIEVERVNKSIVNLDELNNKHEEDLVTIDLTENFLPEFEQVNNSTSRLNNSDEFVPMTRPSDNERVSRSASSCASKTSMNRQIIVKLDRIDIHSIKSIATVGKCPITARGEVDERPPQMKQIDRTITPRDLITEELSAGAMDFYNRLRNDCNVSSDNSKHSKVSEDAGKPNSSPDTRPNNSNTAKTHKSPYVSITRLSQNEIENYLLPSRNLVFDSASTTRRSENCVRISNEKPMNSKSTRVRRSLLSPIILDNRCELRKLGKKYIAKDKSVSLVNSNKKEGEEENTPFAKKRRLAEEANTSASSTVDEWMCRNESRPQTGREQVNADLLATILEKLDTTLYEIRQNTRKLLAEVVARTRSRLEAKTNEQRELILQTWQNLCQTIKDQDKSLLEQFETQIRDVFRDWVRQEEGLVALLREDVQAAPNRANDDV